MHIIQKKLLELAQTQDLHSIPLRQVTRMVGETHPQKVKHHMQKLNLLPATKKKAEDLMRTRLTSIPLLGLASCGEAKMCVGSFNEKYLQISNNILPTATGEYFAVQAVGDSMNEADVQGDNIEDGDYVIVDSSAKDFENNDYVLSIINELANIKKYTKSTGSKQIILSSESTQDYPPIYIHEDDMSYFMSSGKVVAVLKKPSIKENEDLVYSSV